MLHNLFSFQQTKELLSNLAAGDLTEDGIGELRKMGPLDLLVLKTVRGLRPLIRVVENSASRLHKKMEELEARSEIVTDHAAGVNVTIRDMAEAIHDSAERSQQVAAEMSDVNQLLMKIKGTHQELSQSSEKLTGLVGEGQIEMTSALQRMLKVTEENTWVQQKMESVRETVAQISTILKLVQDVSSQTQMLSLNSSIEAARAGGQGSGFSVVAKEIGKLSKQTKDAVREIELLLASVNGSTNELQEGVRRMNETTEDGMKVMTKAHDRYEIIVSYLSQTTKTIQEAEQSIHGIEHASFQVSEAMQNISAMVEETAAGIEQILASAQTQQATIEDMRTLIKEVLRSGLSLRSSVSQFKLPQEGPGGKFQQLAHDWIESALQVRVMMIKVFEITDKNKLDAWYQELCHQDDWMKGSFARLGDVMVDSEDRAAYEYLYKCWNDYLTARDKNVRLLFAGEFARAKDGVMNEARERFKQAMDHMYEWLEASYKDSQSKLA